MTDKFGGPMFDQLLHSVPINDGCCIQMRVYGHMFYKDVWFTGMEATMRSMNTAILFLQHQADEKFGPIWRKEIEKNYAQPSRPLSHRLSASIHDCIIGHVYMVVRGIQFEREIRLSRGTPDFKDTYALLIQKYAEEICREADLRFGRDWVLEVGLGLLDPRACCMK